MQEKFLSQFIITRKEMASTAEYAPFDAKELAKVLKSDMFAPQSQPVPWLAIKTLRPFYLLHILKRNKSDCYLPTTNKKLMYLRASGKKISEKYRPEMLALIKKGLLALQDAQESVVDGATRDQTSTLSERGASV